MKRSISAPFVLLLASFLPADGFVVVPAFKVESQRTSDIAYGIEVRTSTRSRRTLLHETARPKIEGNNAAIAQETVIKAKKKESVVFFFPLVAALLAFFTHQQLALAFHKLCDALTQLTWDASGSEVLDLVRAGLNGAVVGSIAILFGTLVSNTISILIDRNQAIMRFGIATTENIRTCRLYFDTLAIEDRDEANRRMDGFVRGFLNLLWRDKWTITNIRKLSPILEDCVRIVHKSSLKNTPGAAIGEAYAAINELKQTQASLMATVQLQIPWFYYTNLVTLASSICLIFLIETDPDIVNFAAEPQLAVSWSLLIGTFSMLFVVIADLTSPLTSITRVSGKLGVPSFSHTCRASTLTMS